MLCPACRWPIRCNAVVGKDAGGPIYCNKIVEAVYARFELCECHYVRSCKSIEDSCRVPTAVLAGAIELHRECEAARKREQRAIERNELLTRVFGTDKQIN